MAVMRAPSNILARSHRRPRALADISDVSDVIGVHIGCWITVLLVCLGVAAASAEAGDVVKTIRVTGPTVIAFLPPAAKDRSDSGSGAAEAVAHVGFALEDTQKCLGTRLVKYRLIYADRLVITSDRRRYAFALKKMGQGVGAILLAPAKGPRQIHTTIGPSSLMHMLPTAAAEYYGAAPCDKS